MTMLRILAVDDNINIAQMVQKQVLDSDFDVDEVNIATSAAEARKMMEEKAYSILLCDIEMPGEDGIQFSKWVAEKFPGIKIIFLTSHADFGYVKEALSIHSFDYLLQPAAQVKLQSVVRKAITMLEIENANRRLLGQGKFFDEHQDSILDENTVAFLEGRSADAECFRRILHDHHIPDEKKEGSFFALVEFMEDNWESLAFDTRLIKYALYNIFEELFQPLGMRVILIRRSSREYYLLMDAEFSLLPDRHELESLLNTAHRCLESLVQGRSAVYCSDGVHMADCREAVAALAERKSENVAQKNGVFFVKKENRAVEPYSFENQTNLWKKLLQAGDTENLKNNLHDMLAFAEKRGILNLQYLMSMHQAFTELLLNFLIESQIDSSEIFDDTLTYSDYMLTFVRLDTFQKAIDTVIDRIHICLVDRKQTRDEVEMVRQYVMTHIDEELPVSELAEYAALNPEYLSRLFKKRTGSSLKEYIIQKKIEVAQLLMDTTNLSISVVADHVGYPNYNNFSRIFKKYVGCTPQEYKKNNKQNMNDVGK